jgi:hypothetical protein
MSVLDLNALNELPKVERILALAEPTPSWKTWTPKGAGGRFAGNSCRVTMRSRRADGY